MLNVAVKAARAAGAIINRAALDVEAVRISQKQVNDFVTEVDQAAEAVIIETMLTAYPGHGILAEESGSAHGAKDSDYVWIIDPLDGTTNFIHGFPVYCVSIALAVKGKIEQAVIYDPSRNDLFTATRGRGAYMNDRRLRVSKRTRLQESMVSTGFPYRPGDNLQHYLKIMGEVMQHTAAMRRPGAAALDLAYVAAGYTEAFFETGLSPWDVAAGSLLVTEAGGLVGNFTGESDFLHQRECLAGCPRIYGQMVALLAPHSKYNGAQSKRSAADDMKHAMYGDPVGAEVNGQSVGDEPLWLATHSDASTAAASSDPSATSATATGTASVDTPPPTPQPAPRRLTRIRKTETPPATER